jgi:hypothetical protein
MNPTQAVPMDPDNFWAEVMATIQAEKDAMGDEEIDPAYYMPRESGDAAEKVVPMEQDNFWAEVMATI